MNAGIVHSLFNQLYFRDSLSTWRAPSLPEATCATKTGMHSHTAIPYGAGKMPLSLVAAI